MTNTDLAPIQAGFSNMAEEYDSLAKSHPVVIWMRDRIRAVVEKNAPAGGSILEINAGSGLDASYFASKGYRVHATDIAPGMLASLAAKAASVEGNGSLTREQISFTELDKVPGAPYDVVFSNLGGLNCIDDLSLATRHLEGVIRPGGVAVLVVMPPVCPWEIGQAVRGHFKTAFRRLGRKGTTANVGGSSVRVAYYTASAVEKALGPGFERVSLRSICTFAPPSFFDGFARRHRGLTRWLMRRDDRLGALWPFREIGDFFVLVARRR